MISGLEDVIAAETVLSDVDGQGGRLTLRGHALADVAGRFDYARLVGLLFDGFFDDLPIEIAPALGTARADVFDRLTPMFAAFAGLDL